MKTPFDILDVPEDSDDRTVKKAYLQMVKRYPPERFSTEFQRIRTAYELIKTRKDRLRYVLFDTTLPTTEELISDIRASCQGSRPDSAMLRKLVSVTNDHIGQTGSAK